MADAPARRMTKHQPEARAGVYKRPGLNVAAMEDAVDLPALGCGFTGGIIRHG